MADQTLTLTESDIKDSNLLLRYLRKSADRILSLNDRLGKIESRPNPPTITGVRDSLQATGNIPINVTGLLGVLAQPQPASASVYTVAPTGQVLQSLRDQQLVLVGNTSTGFSLNYVQGGNPNTLYQLTAGLSTGSVSSTSTNLMTLDTAQTSTGAKSLTLAAGAVTTPSLTFSTSTSNGIYTTSSGSFSLGVLGAQVMNFSTVGVAIVKKLTSYNGDTLTGNGVPTIVAMASGSGLSGTQTAALFTPPALGRYRVSYYIYTQTTGSDNIAPTYLWTDSSSSKSYSDAPMSLVTTNFQFGDSTLLCGTTTTIRFQTASAAGTGTYSFVCTLERLS